MSEVSTGEFLFPDEFASPKTKAKDEYGVKAALAMFHSKNRQGYSIYTQENQNYNALVELAQGRQSTSNIRKMFGFFDAGERASTSKDNASLAYVDIQVINFATKYVNRAVAKLQKYKYKIGLTATDAVSVNEAKEYDAKIKTYYELKDYMQTMGQNAQQFFEDVDVAILPEYPEELMFNLSANQKIRKIVDGEKTIQLVNGTINNMGQIMRQIDWDLVVLGKGHIHTYLDENNLPKADWINSKYWGGSYVSNEDYSKQEYSFFIDFITVNQFRKEAEGKMTKENIEKVMRSHAYPSTIASWNTLPEAMDNFDGLRYIPVMRFYFLSNDHRAYAKWKSTNTGNTMMEERPYTYTPKDGARQQDIIKNVYTTVYGGSWVVDSDIVYNYGPKATPRSNLVDTRLPIVTFAPNQKEGRYVSLLSQMIEPLVMINIVHNKVKEILAKGYLGVMELNLTAFENLSLTKGGKAWTPQDAIDFLFQTKIAVTRQQMNPHGGSVGNNVNFTQVGLMITDYFNTMSQQIRILDDLSGSTLAETNEIPDRLTSKTMVANVASGSDAIEYLINGHTQIYYQSTHQLLLLTQEAKRNKSMIRGMIPALGKYTTEFFEVPDDLPYCDYGLTMEREATPEEWAEFYAELSMAVQKEMLNSSDSAFIREINNMTQARLIMANRERLNEKKAQAARAQEQDFQMKIQTAGSQANLQTEMQILEKKKNDDMEILALDGKIRQVLQQQAADLNAISTGMSDQVRKEIDRQKGVDTIIKEAIRAKSEGQKSQNKLTGDMIKSQQQAETAIATAEINAKKPKATAK